uniref:Calpain 10 n=1 Tax=Xiphophorus couchianus TaxID=32473 RepID=A0A3B5LJA8_9TELE
MRISVLECAGPSLFEDLDFPTTDSSLFSDSSTPIAQLHGEITWRRPQEICQSPSLFPTNTNLAHAKQGLLGDCWFLCACTFLLKNQHLLDKVFPPGQPQWGSSKYMGSFQFLIWQQGHWTEVIVDDRLPCMNSCLCFSRCHSPSAFWIALLEKAYATWFIRAALGRTGEKAGPEPPVLCERRVCIELLHPQLSWSELDQHHALTVMEWLDVRKVSGSDVRLLRIRNPWGRCCWAGAWTWSGIGWSFLDPVCTAELRDRTAEGEFWLDEAEFTSQFDDITVGYPIGKDGLLKSVYTGTLLTHSHQLASRWIKGHSAGGSRNTSSYSSNPKFWLKVCETGEVLVSLLQHRKRRNTEKYAQTDPEDSSNTKHQHYQAIALHMWKVEKKRFSLSRMLNKPPCASTHCHSYEREVVLCRLLEPGFYLLIPSTYQPGAEAHFLIRVFSSSPTSLSALKSPAPSLPLTSDGEWETSFLRGSWIEGRTAGGSRNFPSYWKNPCFPFAVCDEPALTSGVNVRITLHQSRPDTDLHPIGFHVYKVSQISRDNPFSLFTQKDPVASCIPHCYTQDVSLACTLPPGSYTIVPSTYQPDCSAKFRISLARKIHRLALLSMVLSTVSHISVMKT